MRKHAAACPFVCIRSPLAAVLATAPAFAAVPQGVTRWLPPGYDVLGSATMHAGKPSRTIMIVALGRKGENDTHHGAIRAPARPLLLFAERPGGLYSRIGRNDTVVDRADGGGQCDPFLDGGGTIAVRGPFFTVQNGVACGQHWTDFVTFRFDDARGRFVFDNEQFEAWMLNPSNEPGAEAVVRDGPHRVRRGSTRHVVEFDAWHPER